MTKITDFLVIGSGIAGLTFALEVAPLGQVTVICKRDPHEGSTRYAQGGIASVTDPLDSFEEHIEDTLVAGDGLCHENIVRTVVEEGPKAVERLIEIGAQFDRERTTPQYELGQEGGHSHRRILHARDATGKEVQRALYERVSEHPNIEIYPEHIAIDLISHESKTGELEVLGAYVFDATAGNVVSIGARCTLLASGGAGKVYLYTSNPDVSTGDGIAMAYRAGAPIMNMEFFQFHPTCLYHPRAKSFLISEALRGEGAVLCDLEGEEFMSQYHPKRELASRDIVARAIDDHMKKTGSDYVLLDISHRESDFLRSRFPTIYERALEFGFDLTKEPLPVVPAAHYCCGGVQTDNRARTPLRRLYAVGEAAWSGLHGANRLASNSLLEALIFAYRAAHDVRRRFSELDPPEDIKPWDYLDTVKSSEQVVVSHAWDELRRTMWNLVGIVRSDTRLGLAKRRVRNIKREIRDYYWKFRLTRDLIELRNIIQVAEIIVSSAEYRKESRGLHYTLDFPSRDDQVWKHDTVCQLGSHQEPEVGAVEVR